MKSKALITSASNKFFPSLLNLIGSIKINYPEHPPIYVYDLGLNFLFIKQLQGIEGVKILKVPHFVSHWRSCYTWKTYIHNTPLADLNFYLDSGNQVLRSLDEIFDKIDTRGYLLVSSGNEVVNEDITPKEFIPLFDLNDDFLKQGIIAAGMFGFKKGDELVKKFTSTFYDCGYAGLCLGFSKTEQWKNKGVNKTHFIRNAKYFRHDNTLFCILVYKILVNAVQEPLSSFDAKLTGSPQQYTWNLRLNYKTLQFAFHDISKCSGIIKNVNKLYIKVFFLLKEINRILKGNKYA